VYGYELISAAIDPEHPGHTAAVGEFGRFYGNDIHPRVFDLVLFDMDEVNGAIAALGIDDAGPPRASIPEPLKELAGAIRTTGDRRQLLRLTGAALAEQP
jgi:hypothetical protein